ncbi:hypothetical protein UlMin_030125 [Ulmus minor]
MSDQKVEQKLQFVFVHGAGHGGWCWYNIRSLLESVGHKVTCIDLKGGGIDLTDANTIKTFKEFNEPLVSFFSSLPADEKVILVGHSAGGLNITEILHKFPNNIHVAVYIAAIMMKNGISLPHGTRKLPCFPEEDLCDYIFQKLEDKIKNLIPSSVIIKPEHQRQRLYNMSPIEDSTLASMLLRPYPVWPMFDAGFNDTTDVDSIPRIYIKTLNDNMMSKLEHDVMILQWKPSKVVTLESDHSPFFSTPLELFKALLEAAASVK